MDPLLFGFTILPALIKILRIGWHDPRRRRLPHRRWPVGTVAGIFLRKTITIKEVGKYKNI